MWPLTIIPRLDEVSKVKNRAIGGVAFVGSSYGVLGVRSRAVFYRISNL